MIFIIIIFLCPEKIEVTYDMLSKHCKDMFDWYDIKIGGSIVKWSVLAHLKSQPRGQNFQAQI